MDTTNMEEKGYVATIGMFDGVHRGHQFVLRQVVNDARQHGLQSLVITFDRKQSLLTPLEEKTTLISNAGIDRIEILPFTDELKAMTAREFMEQVLKERFHVRILLIGYDNRFGHNRVEGFEDYVRYGRELNIEVRQLPADGEVSSSRIRQHLQQGQVSDAAQCLGHPYTITGSVEHGEHIGTKLGFPTANIAVDDPNKLLPAPGVYAMNALVGGRRYAAMANLGAQPTFHTSAPALEVHIIDFSSDIYGQRVTVEFLDKIRDIQTFDSPQALVEQLKDDCSKVKALCSNTPPLTSLME